MATKRFGYFDTGATLTCVATLQSNNDQVVPTVTEPVNYVYQASWTAADGIHDLVFSVGADVVFTIDDVETKGNVVIGVGTGHGDVRMIL